MNADHEVLLSYNVRLLSKGNVSRVFEMKYEISLFLEGQGKQDLAVYFNDEAWLKGIVYETNILEQQNWSFKKKETKIIEFKENVRPFLSKLQNWWIK